MAGRGRAAGGADSAGANWARSTRTGGLFRGRSGHGFSDRPSMRSSSWPTARCSSPRIQGSSGFLADKGRMGVSVRIALGDPDGPQAAQRGEEEGIGDAMPAKIRNALMLYRPLCAVGEHRDPPPPDRAVQLDLPRRRPAAGQSAHLRDPGRAGTRVLPMQHPTAERWLPSTSTASSACGLVLRRSHSIAMPQARRSRAMTILSDTPRCPADAVTAHPSRDRRQLRRHALH